MTDTTTDLIANCAAYYINPLNGRYVCTPELPMPKGAKGRWEHTNVEEVGDQENGWPSGDYQYYHCRDCGYTWGEELPQ
jgi:hypothetical protein